MLAICEAFCRTSPTSTMDQSLAPSSQCELSPYFPYAQSVAKSPKRILNFATEPLPWFDPLERLYEYQTSREFAGLLEFRPEVIESWKWLPGYYEHLRVAIGSIAPNTVPTA